MTLTTLTLNTTTKAISSGKKLTQTTTKKEERVTVPAVQTARTAIKTVLVASYGWPTEAMQPSRKQTARR
jgi:hypothetical protein